MTDNIDITPGSGKTILTDDCTTGHAQIVKLAVATDGSAAMIPADATDGMLVNLGSNNAVTVTSGTVTVGAALPAGDNNIGNVDVLSLPALPAGDNNIGNVDVVSLPAIPAGGNAIGSVAVNNAGAGSAVNIQDGGNSITVDGTVGVSSLPALPAGDNNIGNVDVLSLPALPVGDNNIGNVDVVTLPGTAGEAASLPTVFMVCAGDDGTDTQPLQLSAGGDLKITLDSETVTIQDGGNVITVDASNLDIRDLAHTADSVKVGDGTSFIDIDTAPTDGEANGGKRLLHTEAWLWGFNGVSWDRLRSDTTNGLDVDVTRVGGSVTVIQGTSANLKAEVYQGSTWTESNSGSILTALQIMDDWDETNRCAVNPISGQIGVQGGSGAVSGTTQRVVLATDVGLPAGTSNIGDVDVLTVGGQTPAFGSGARSAATQRVTIATDDVVLATPFPSASSSGISTYHLVSAATTNATNIKNAAGQLYGYYIYNSNASMRKLCFHNTSGTPTAGASIFFTIPIPGGSAANVWFDGGVPFSSGIAITTVTDLADNGTTAVGLNDLNINLFWK